MSDHAQDHVTTSEVAAAAQVHPATITRWVKQGVLPTPQIVNMGRWGRSTRFPLHAPEQARWVRMQLESGRTFAEIRSLLEAGGFKTASVSGASRRNLSDKPTPSSDEEG